VWGEEGRRRGKKDEKDGKDGKVTDKGVGTRKKKVQERCDRTRRDAETDQSARANAE
jgi:hypothetical protein